MLTLFCPVATQRSQFTTQHVVALELSYFVLTQNFVQQSGKKKKTEGKISDKESRLKSDHMVPSSTDYE